MPRGALRPQGSSEVHDGQHCDVFHKDAVMRHTECGAGRCAARNSAVPQVAGGGIYAVFSHTHTYGRLQKKAG